MINTVEIEALGRQGVLMKKTHENVYETRGLNLSQFFREMLENVGLDTVYFVVNITFYGNTKQRSAIIGHYVIENGMLIPINANVFRVMWEFEF